ncbi:heterokaryon incompatibility protein-domain-containing protein [Paraphoma chrysanthemicola]|nr:heterokaryon incompatibility protein-domain-containing protein [Paraphoma chrysanthemicola]
MEVYCYRRLDPELSFIRLIRIHRTDESSPIVLSIRHASLDDNEPFNALSYAWGDESPLHDIVIHDDDRSTYISIRQNLYDFLLTARNSEKDWSLEWIWIDQICINQSDHEERCHQVAQMGWIYSKALSTIVWPGLTTHEHDRASDLASSTLLCDKDEVEAIRNTPVAISEMAPIEPALPSESAVRLLSMATDSLIRAPYWSRLWIIQEIVIASQVYIVIAGQIWDFSEFLLVLVMLDARLKCSESKMERHIADDLQDLRDWADMIWFQHKLGKANIKLNSWALVFVLAAGAKCTSPLDRVYGVMALVPKELQVYPDYSVSQRQLLRTIVGKQLSSAPFQTSVWDALFHTLTCWTVFFEFESIELIRDIPSQIFLDESLDLKIKKYIVRLVLDDLELPQPTIILSPVGQVHWKAATYFLLESYINGADIDVRLSSTFGENIDELEQWSPADHILRHVRLQQQLIKETAKRKLGPPVIRFRRRIVLSTTHKDLQGRARRSRSVIVQKFWVNKISTADNTTEIQGRHVPKLLIELHTKMYDDEDGDYNTGILLP